MAMRSILWLAGAVASTVLLACSPGEPEPSVGDADTSPVSTLDGSFGDNGVVLLPSYNGSFAPTKFADVAVDSQGRIVIGGVTTAQEMAVWRLAPDGSIDTGFGSAGQATLSGTYTSAVAIDATDHPITVNFGSVHRSTPDGVVDTTFDGDGMARLSDSGTTGSGYDVTTDSSGRILVAGVAGAPGIDMAIWRLTGDGGFDTTFGGSGAVSLDGTVGAGQTESASQILVQSDTTIVVAGTSNAGPLDDKPVVWKLDATGALDSTFGDQGAAVIDERAVGAAVTVDTHGRISTTGTIHSNNQCVPVWRLEPEGTMDATFGVAGRACPAAPAARVDGNDILSDPQDRVIVIGGTMMADGWRLLVMRLNDDGTLDTTFADGGTFVTTAPGMSNCRGEAGAFANDGALIVAGKCDDSAASYAAIWRINL